MKRVIKFISLIVISMLLFGCDSISAIKLSELKEENAEVITMNYIPSRSSSSVSPGISMDGDLVLSMSSTSFPEVYTVTLRCLNHVETFTLQSKELFNRVKIGDGVILKYVDKIKYYPYDKDKKYPKPVVGHRTMQIICKDESTITR